MAGFYVFGDTRAGWNTNCPLAALPTETKAMFSDLDKITLHYRCTRVLTYYPGNISASFEE